MIFYMSPARKLLVSRISYVRKDRTLIKDLDKPLYPEHFHFVRRMYFSDRSLIETCMVDYFYDYWNHLQSITESIKYRVRYSGNIYVYTSFLQKPSLTYSEILILAFIKMIEIYAYQISSSYVKVTLGYKVKLKEKKYEFSYTLGPSIPLYDLSGALIQRRMVYDQIERKVRKHSEQYENALVIGVF